MRITDTQVYGQQVRRINRLRGEQVSLHEQVASGRRVSRPSDAPDAWARLSRLAYREQGVDAYNAQGDALRTRLSAAESALSQVTNLLQRARELTVQGLNGSYSASERRSFAAELSGIREHMVQLANTEQDGQHLFSGVKTDSPPFNAQGEYLGGEAGVLVQVGEGVKVDAALDGGEVFAGEVDIFAMLGELIVGFEANDVGSLDGALEEIRGAEEQILRSQTDLGGRLNRIDLAREMSDELKLVFSRERQFVGDTDLAATISQMAGLEQALQAAVQVSQTTMQPGLLDIL
jgi:flagellar hook-associated protein 3 FlgL